MRKTAHAGELEPGLAGSLSNETSQGNKTEYGKQSVS